ncbi:cytochrome P450 [Obba rivulosa]|uniref:Cytochrome P450 n=1 Tax=Obba rivulosa TaxID=1052685 RepID=A0A8E2J5F2_9APHY|nr:cytochrome P450 [Obba rivulosa]
MSLSISSVPLLVGLAIALLWKYVKNTGSQYRDLALPPGPKRLPLIGNVLDVPTEQHWKTYAEWTQKYGDVIYLQVFGQSIIVLNSVKAVVELFEKRSVNNSDRPHSEMVALMGFDWAMGSLRYGQWWRRHRRAFHQYFNQNEVPAYEPRLHDAARRLLRRLLREPEDFLFHIRYVFGAIFLSVVYGIEAAEGEDEHIATAERALHGVEEAFNPGSFWVDFLPFLKYVPAWMPGAVFQKKAAEWRVDCVAMKRKPWQNVVKDGEYAPVAAKLAERLSHLEGEEYAQEEEVAQNVAGIAYGAGADTSVSTLQCFFQAMILFPKVQKLAQEELARVVGPLRLPQFSDRESLPYIRAICKECLRWQPVVPLGLAHQSITDDKYRGYFIPGSTILIQNTWGILHNPEEYPEPDEFRPERFLKDGKWNPDVMDPGVIAFGAGRRICPGRYLSELTLFITIACVLHTFDITPALDLQGKPIIREIKMTSGVVSHPEPFECNVKPRSSLAESLILE